MGYGYGYVMGYGLVQTVAWSILVKVFGFRLRDSMLLTAYRDISRGQAHDGLWITVVNAHGSRITGHLSWIMEYWVGKLECVLGQGLHLQMENYGWVRMKEEG